jgi:hypothetical protein
MNLKTIDIHGKQYVQVNERIKYFREHYKGWSLTSEFVELTENRCVIRAIVRNEEGREIADGVGEEIKGSTYINKTSFIENCQTSAWGRALGNLGIGIDNNISSADEVKIAIAQDKPKTKEKLNGAKYQAMREAIAEGNIEVVEKRMDNYKLTKKQEKELSRLINEAKIASQSK